MRRLLFITFLCALACPVCLLGAEQSSDTEQQAKKLAEEVLHERPVVVRVYNEWQTEPSTYDLVSTKLDGLRVSFDKVRSAFGDVGKWPAVVLVADDQSDEAVATVMGDAVHAALYRKGEHLSIWPSSLVNRQAVRAHLQDALGRAVGQAKVELCLGYTVSASNRPRIENLWLRDTIADKDGSFRLVHVDAKYWELSVLVTHPTHGRALAVPFGEPPTYVVPWGPSEPEVAARSLWGTVLDDKGNPVEAAVVRCRSLLAPGRVGTSAFPKGGHKVWTDESGRFCLTVPIKEQMLAPLNSRYSVEVWLPDYANMAVDYSHAPAGKQYNVVISTERHLHTFGFEDADGPITDVERLKSIVINIRRPEGASFSLGYEQWKDGGTFPPGTYTAILREKGRRQFQPVEVTADSRKHIIFTMRESLLYFGQVVHALTDEPIPGALAMLGRYERTPTNEDFSCITAKQWDSIHALPLNPSAQDPALEPLKALCRFDAVVRTDAQGRFTMEVEREAKFPGIVFAEQDFLGREFLVEGGPPPRPGTKRPGLKPSEDGVIQLPTTRLYPAATLLFEVCMKEQDDTVQVRTYRTYDRQNNAWGTDFSRGRHCCRHKFVPQDRQSLHVPAGLDMAMKLLWYGSQDVDTRWLPIVLPNPKDLQQGQRLDLGRLTFEKAKPTYVFHVKVIGPTGKPVEGLGVWNLPDDQRYWNTSSITDEQGMATFHLPLHSAGRFAVRLRREEKEVRKEMIAYETGGQEDIGKQFVLPVSNEFLRLLFE